MKIKEIKVGNYKSIVSSKPLTLHQNFNILSGRNNSGKTALLEAIFKGVSNEPADYIMNPFDCANLELLFTMNEDDRESLNAIDESLSMILKEVSYLKVKIEFLGSFTTFESVTTHNEKKELIQTLLERTGIKGMRAYSPRIKAEEFQKTFLQWLSGNIIFISTNRNTLADASIKLNEDIDSLASNLYTVLFTFRNNKGDIFDKIQTTFLTIFPEVKRIHTQISENKEGNYITNVLLEFIDSKEPIKLQDCGSGYTQILLSLCLIYSEDEKIILFDEPNTYLHPYAEKAIYDLAARGDKHQYVFSTHSPMLINYPIEKSIYFVKREDGQSIYAQIDNIQEVLKDIGASNSNYAFSDRVIFVEGQTEEKILPIIFRKNNFEQLGYNYTIINLKGTGDEFGSQKAMNNYSRQLEKIFNSISNSPIPYRILIDRDEKNQDMLKKIEENYKGKAFVLPRREIENYFLVPEAIEALIKHYLPNQDVTVDIVQEQIDACLEDTENRELYPKGCQNKIEDVKGSKVLKRILSEYKIEYSKVNHGFFITEWLYNNNNNKLNVIYSFFKDFLEN